MDQKKKNDDEISFLLSNVNESSTTVRRPIVTSYQNEEKSQHQNIPLDDPPPQISRSDSFANRTDNESPSWSSSALFDTSKSPTIIYLIIGLIVMIIVGTLISTIGVFVSAPIVIFEWFIGWFIVCCGGFYCIARKPRAIHICNGATIGLIFGILVMVSFSIVRDIVNRPFYGPVDVDTVPDFVPQDGSIVYFNQGQPNTTFLGQYGVNQDPSCTGSQCTQIYFCVAPIVDPENFQPQTTVVDFWAGCQVSEPNKNCNSDTFFQSDCYADWQVPLDAGFAYGVDNREGLDFLSAVRASVIANELVITAGSPGNFSNFNPNTTQNLFAVVVLYSPDPAEEAAVFYTLGWLLVAAAPLIYCVYSLVYNLMCKERMQLADYEVIR